MSSDPLATSDGSPPWHARIASVPRLGRTKNEDLAAVIGSAAWVLDGASVPQAAEVCVYDAHWYVHRLSAALEAALARKDGVDLPGALEAAIDQVAREHKARCSCTLQGAAPSSTVALVRCRGATLDYLVLGDSTVILDLGDHVDAVSDRRLSLVASGLREQLRNHIASGRGYNDERYRALHRDLVAAERNARNLDGGYWIASLDPQAALQSLTGSAVIGPSEEGVRRAGLMSDGLARSVTHLGLYPGWGELLADLATRGPKACIEATRAIEMSDPQGIRFPRSTRSDDASGIVLDFIA